MKEMRTTAAVSEEFVVGWEPGEREEKGEGERQSGVSGSDS